MTSTRYHLVGAFDRHNYGDILFPMVHSQFLMSQGVSPEAIQYCAITAADLRDQGGYATQSVRELLGQKLGPQDVVVMCGGDILSADWLLMVAHLHSTVFLKLARAARRLIGVSATNDLVRRLQGEKNAFPYVISRRDGPQHVFYTAVGGAGFNSRTHLQRVAEELRRIDRISVRDRQAQALLASAGIQADLIPDTALIMSEFYTPEVLAARDWTASLQTHGGFDLQRYYSFQGAKRLLQNHLDTLTQELIEVHRRTGLAPLFVPIGRAPDHEDHVVLAELYRRLVQQGLPCAYLDSLHVLDIMAALAFAKTYVGTSLHGAITTYSFGHKPCALFSGEVKKLQDFLSTWLQSGDYAFFPEARFAEAFCRLVDSGTALSDQTGLARNKASVRSELGRYLQG